MFNRMHLTTLVVLTAIVALHSAGQANPARAQCVANETAKLLASDGAAGWVKRAGGSSADFGFGVSVLSDGSAVVTGYFNGTATFGPGEANETTLTSAGDDDVFIAKYHPDGTLARTND